MIGCLIPNKVQRGVVSMLPKNAKKQIKNKNRAYNIATQLTCKAKHFLQHHKQQKCCNKITKGHRRMTGHTHQT
jgi:hypothetical protein